MILDPERQVANAFSSFARPSLPDIWARDPNEAIAGSVKNRRLVAQTKSASTTGTISLSGGGVLQHHVRRLFANEQGGWMNPATYPSTGHNWQARAFGDYSP
jgi:hypothetical protein